MKTLTEDMQRKFDNLLCNLSPENLACDGEASAAEICRKRASIMREWAALERLVGRKVTEDEVYKNGAGY